MHLNFNFYPLIITKMAHGQKGGTWGEVHIKNEFVIIKLNVSGKPFPSEFRFCNSTIQQLNIKKMAWKGTQHISCKIVNLCISSQARPGDWHHDNQLSLQICFTWTAVACFTNSLLPLSHIRWPSWLRHMYQCTCFIFDISNSLPKKIMKI